MDTLDPDTRHKALRAIDDVLEELAAIHPNYGDSHQEVEIQRDETSGHFAVWHIGWSKWERIHFCLLHIDIKNGKIWIQHDGTPLNVTERLVEAGVSPQQIVIGFHPPSERHLTPYGVG